jgi:hypothetical protein
MTSQSRIQLTIHEAFSLQLELEPLGSLSSGQTLQEQSRKRAAKVYEDATETLDGTVRQKRRDESL